ncbi:MAG: hypothetical protein KKD39_06425, partial [Candidatus Altiarchaeota archaeon]|nr:hypothetical protein [Candidatus Altiarchaeota archaeon]
MAKSGISTQQHGGGEATHDQIASLNVKGLDVSQKWQEMKDISRAAFKDSDRVLRQIKEGIEGSSNKERIVSRFYCLLDTLFREKVFQNPDTAWDKLVEITQPSVAQWGSTPCGLGFSALGHALRARDNPEEVLDRLGELNQIKPPEIVGKYSLNSAPEDAKFMHVVLTVWSEDETSHVDHKDRYYPQKSDI